MAGRRPTQAQISAAGQREFTVLWQRLPAGKIFPASVGYVNSLGAKTTATLVGIAPPRWTPGRPPSWRRAA
jgi:hypothetical protein